jgi:LAO/AO transport system kinase
MTPMQRPATPAPGAEIDPALRELVNGLLGGNARALAKAITLVESSRPDHQARAIALLDALQPSIGQAFRLGISGVPGAGKSTFIEAFGLMLIARGHKVAVLAVDPTSGVSGGSILGDKTRMERLSRERRAFIRPSPSGGTLGGVARKTREAISLCEAAGYDIVIVETVGVGQSETAVAGMTDLFVLLALPNAGDDLQAIKRGIVELADVVLVNKADTDPAAAALARAQIAGAFAMLRSRDAWWAPPVLAVSATAGTGLADFMTEIERYRSVGTANGALAARRQRQALAWVREEVERELLARFYEDPAVRNELDRLSQAVSDGAIAPSHAVARLLSIADRR